MIRIAVACTMLLAVGASPVPALAASSATVTVTVTTKVNGMDWSGPWTRMQIADAQGALQPAPEPGRVRFEVDGQLAVAMSVGCNQIGSTLQPGEGDAITFTPAMATRMACEGAVGEAETRLFDALEKIARYEARGEDVVFMAADGQALLLIGH